MSQIRGGTVAVTNGSPNIVGTGTSFLQARKGHMFTVANSNVSYFLGADPVDDTHGVLASNYAEASASGQSYSITTSFTAILGILYMMQKDIDTATIWARAVAQIEAFLVGPKITGAAAPIIASGTTIAPTKEISFVSGTTTIQTITPPSSIIGGGKITLIPTGLWATGTSGNIAIASTAVVSKALTLTYDATTTKWYPSY